jgi:hypothetical protein
MIRLVLAQYGNIDRYRAMRSGIEETNGSSQWVTLLLILVGLAGLVGLAVLTSYLVRRRRSLANSPDRLFRQALAALDLPAVDVYYLRQIKRKIRYVHPAVILMSPRLLGLAASRAAAPEPLIGNLRQRCDEVSRRLFGEPVPELVEDPPIEGLYDD